MPSLEIVTMRTLELLFPIPSYFSYTRGGYGNDTLRSLMVSFGNQSPNYLFLKRVI